MENDGKSKSYIESTARALNRLPQENLNNPEAIKRFIAKKECTNSYKRNLCNAYDLFAQYYKIEWEKPHYKPEARNVRIPTKEKLEQLIAHSGRKMATKLQISFETGMRPIEVCDLRAKDIDLDRRLIYPTTAKHGSARTLKISLKLQAMLQDYINREQIKPDERLFKLTPRSYTKLFRLTRDALARKLHDASLQQIRLYDFRHYFATMTYHKTRDILLTKTLLGHKRIENTLIYTQLLNLNEDEWICKGTSDLNEATKLIEAGFEYVTEIDGTKLFRKRK